MNEHPQTHTESVSVVVAMPISRILLEERIQFSSEVFAYPPGELQHLDARLAGLNPEKINSVPSALRQLASDLSGISWDVFEQSPLLVFPSSLPKDFLNAVAHAQDLLLLERFSAEGERYMDRLRFAKCDMHLPDTLPGRVGTWDHSEGFSGALAYDIAGGNSYLLGGKYHSHQLCIGLGLDPSPCQRIAELPGGELGMIVSYALRLYTSALEAADWTSKFVNCIRLFEYLTDPYQVEGSNKWEIVRQRLCLHIAKSKEDYSRLSERFRQMGNVGSGAARGYREQIFHHGKLLEDVIESRTEMKALFRELQSYATKVLCDLIAAPNPTWSEVQAFRLARSVKLGI